MFDYVAYIIITCNGVLLTRRLYKTKAAACKACQRIGAHAQYKALFWAV